MEAKTVAPPTHPPQPVITLGERALTLPEIWAITAGRARVELSTTAEFRRRLQASQAALQAALARNAPVYGVTTGFGHACGTRIGPELSQQLGANLLRYHGCGTGEPLDRLAIRGALLCRLLCFSQGYSAVSPELLDQLVAFLVHDLVPVVPAQGSVGASGDLTPMSYVAAALAGEREVFDHGIRRPAAEALAAAGLQPHRFQPKEPLALLNGTPIMTGIALVALEQAHRLLDAALDATALTVHGLAGHVHHFHPLLFEAKPHPGSQQVAAGLRQRLAVVGPAPVEATAPDALQDPYSVRCTPQILGVLADALVWLDRWVELEANSANDNPLLDPATGEVVTGGNFYGGHLGFAMEGLKNALAGLVDLCDRQIALLVDPRFNRGLPEGLVAAADNPTGLHHGFKALQITASALTAEALQASLPATIFSRPTESHNQDKVSLGTIAARDALRVCSLAGRVVACHLMIAAQAAELRGQLGSRPALAHQLAFIRQSVPRLVADRPLDVELERLAGLVLAGRPEVD